MARELLPGARPAVIPNGIDAERFARPVAAPLTQGPTVLSVGPPKPRKGTLELLRAMARVVAELPQARCVIIGNLHDSPDYVDRVRAEIRRLGLEQRVTLAGQVDETTLLGWYAAAQVFALPSMNIGPRFEGFGLAYLEAGAAGLAGHRHARLRRGGRHRGWRDRPAAAPAGHRGVAGAGHPGPAAGPAAGAAHGRCRGARARVNRPGSAFAAELIALYRKLAA